MSFYYILYYIMEYGGMYNIFIYLIGNDDPTIYFILNHIKKKRTVY